MLVWITPAKHWLDNTCLVSDLQDALPVPGNGHKNEFQGAYSQRWGDRQPEDALSVLMEINQCMGKYKWRTQQTW